MSKGECLPSILVGGYDALFDIPLLPIIRWLFYDESLLIRDCDDAFESPLDFTETTFFFVDALQHPSS
jgi:hypothetical protein